MARESPGFGWARDVEPLGGEEKEHVALVLQTAGHHFDRYEVLGPEDGHRRVDHRHGGAKGAEITVSPTRPRAR